MGKDTSIAWTNSTLNLAWGCTKVSPGCQHCYMYRNSPKFGRDPSQIVYFNIDNARKRLQSYGELVFVNSNTDTFHEKIPFHIIDQWFELFREFPDKQFQVLTKRINRARHYSMTKAHAWPRNVWLGTSVEDQWHTFRIDTLRRIPARIRFVSFEPLLGPIKQADLTDIQWVLIGGESGTQARPMEAEWAEQLVYLGKAYGAAVLFKQMGSKDNHDGAGGDLLNGRQIKEFPKWK